jgi:hypothetical protein
MLMTIKRAMEKQRKKKKKSTFVCVSPPIAMQRKRQMMCRNGAEYVCVCVWGGRSKSNVEGVFFCFASKGVGFFSVFYTCLGDCLSMPLILSLWPDGEDRRDDDELDEEE